MKLRIDPTPETVTGSTPGLTRWAVMAESRAVTRCRLVDPIAAKIVDSDGARVASFLPARQRYRIEIDPYTPTVVAHLNLQSLCGGGHARFEVRGHAPPVAHLEVARLACALTGSPDFSVDGPGPIAGTDCPRGSITLAIDPEPLRTGDTFRWSVTGTAHTTFLCRTHGLDAAIESSDGRVLTGVPGNPAVQNEQFQDVFNPEQPVFVDYLQWTKPCSTGPVVLVVRYQDGMSGPGARLRLAKPRCVDGIAGNFQITGRSTNP